MLTEVCTFAIDYILPLLGFGCAGSELPPPRTHLLSTIVRAVSATSGVWLAGNVIILQVIQSHYSTSIEMSHKCPSTKMFEDLPKSTKKRHVLANLVQHICHHCLSVIFVSIIVSEYQCVDVCYSNCGKLWCELVQPPLNLGASTC